MEAGETEQAVSSWPGKEHRELSEQARTFDLRRLMREETTLS